MSALLFQKNRTVDLRVNIPGNVVILINVCTLERALICKKSKDRAGAYQRCHVVEPDFCS